MAIFAFLPAIFALAHWPMSSPAFRLSVANSASTALCGSVGVSSAITVTPASRAFLMAGTTALESAGTIRMPFAPRVVMFSSAVTWLWLSTSLLPAAVISSTLFSFAAFSPASIIFTKKGLDSRLTIRPTTTFSSPPLLPPPPAAALVVAAARGDAEGGQGHCTANRQQARRALAHVPHRHLSLWSAGRRCAPRGRQSSGAERPSRDAPVKSRSPERLRSISAARQPRQRWNRLSSPDSLSRMASGPSRAPASHAGRRRGRGRRVAGDRVARHVRWAERQRGGARDRVWAAVERLGFEPNHLARSLRRGSTMAVGLVVPDVAVGFYASALKGAQEVLEGRGYHVLVMNTERTAERESAALRMLGAHQVDGVILATSGGYRDIGVPAVFFDAVPADVRAGAVAMCNEEGVGLLVDHLVREHGHELIAYIGPPAVGAPGRGAVHAPARARASGRLHAPRWAAPGCRCPRPTCGPATRPARRRWPSSSRASCSRSSGRPRRSSPGPTRWPSACSRPRASSVSTCPAELAVVSFDEPSHPDLLDPPVTSLDRHDRELGRRAAELLLAALSGANGAAADGVVERVPLDIRVRRSCGCGAG